MIPHAGHKAGERDSDPDQGNAHGEFRRLLAVLASRARRLGSRDPESAAQETLKRSLENAEARPAIEYYFGQSSPADAAPLRWPLDHLFAWLHGVVYNVVREEQSRASSRREMPIGHAGPESGDRSFDADHADPAPGPLDLLIDKELKGIIAESFPKLDRDYRTVLRMRVDGMKYGEIANRLGVSENTVATWVSRGIRELAQHVRRRSQPLLSPRGSER